MKPLIQSEAAECGLACLAMVAGHYGLHMDLPQMRRRFPLSLKGLRLNQLIEHAQQLGLNARALRLEMQDLGQLKLPCILHWDLNHFVVLARVGRKKAVLLDPGAAGDGFAGGFAPLHGRGAGACACAAVQAAAGGACGFAAAADGAGARAVGSAGASAAAFGSLAGVCGAGAL